MKTEAQILAKIKDVEAAIKEYLPISEYSREHVEKLLLVRNALQWTLTKDKFITTDDFKKEIEYELLCFESTKIF